jgi:hypothetical protein
MYKIKVHIKNDNDFLDSNVFVEIQLPAVPRKGEILYLNEEQQEILKKKVKSDLKIAVNYAPKWFYGASSGCENPKEKNLKDLDFGDAIFVNDVVFSGDSEFIQIELDDSIND